MPRGQKSKRQSRKKHEETQSDVQACEVAQETAEAAEESSSSSQSLPDDESSGTLERSPKSLSSSTSTLLVCFSESDDDLGGDSEGSEERLSEAQFSTTNPHVDLIIRKMVELVQVLLHNFNIKQLSTKEELLNVVSKTYEKHFTEIFIKASEKLDEAFAVEVREVHSSPSSYNLISKLKLPNNGRIRAGRGFPKTGFLMCVLGIVFIRGNCASEEEVWKVLKKKKIYPGKKHSIFGEPQKLMTQDFVRLKYLEYRQVANSNPPRYELMWGPQAHVETSKMQVLRFLAKINKTSLHSLLLLYDEVMKDEQEDGQPRDPAQRRAAHMVECPVALPTSLYI
uniref:melanoma-associated antigen B4-like n=1 Tax=Jaculus jaculus TaxID=51337 RepID=UPI0003332D56|nr:melanoma-associated antigen B4-like [Jaculus jaculus]